ncbi:MAG: RnfABCDGE type electron transport complex subunit D [Planctomycetota bacterium]|jgi:Na+-transporting NADH:ubiquinone oxidoreductase subunit B
MRQATMARMVIALTPVAVSGIYFFGWRVAAILGVCLVAGVAAEYLTSRQRSQPVSTACFVTVMLLALSLPATVPLWIAAVGSVVAILFGKEVFGGFGRNFANPAIVGRAFVYICFPTDLTGRFVPAFKGFPAGLTRWSFTSLKEMPAYLAESPRGVVDAVSQASPMWVAREHGFEVLAHEGRGASLWDMLTGSIGGTFQVPGEGGLRVLTAGSIGEGCAILILLTGVYLLWTRTAQWRLMIGGFVGLIVANLLFRNLLGFDGPGEVPPLLWQLASGTTVYAIVYMVTDPVSGTKRRPAQLAYGVFIGAAIVVLRWRGIFVAAATFAILLGNLVGPWMDMAATAWADRRKTKVGAKEGGP